MGYMGIVFMGNSIFYLLEGDYSVQGHPWKSKSYIGLSGL